MYNLHCPHCKELAGRSVEENIHHAFQVKWECGPSINTINGHIQALCPCRTILLSWDEVMKVNKNNMVKSLYVDPFDAYITELKSFHG